MNQKGFTGLEIGAIVVIGLFVASLIAPLVKPFIPGMAGGEGQKSTQKQSYTETIEPYTIDGKLAPHVVAPDGSELLLFKKVKSTATLDEQIQPRPPFFQRVFNWFLKLGIAGGLLALFFPGVAIWLVMFIKGRFQKLKDEIAAHKDAYANLKADTKKIVLGVEKAFTALPPTLPEGTPAVVIIDKIKTALSTTYNDTTKALVADLKQP